MPRNSSGVFSLAEGAFVPGTVISSTAMNADLNDIATAITQSIASTGVTTPTAPIKFVAGAIGAPGVTYTTDSTSGLYSPTVGKSAHVSGGVGILVNSLAYKATAAPIAGGGTGYAVNDEIVLSGGTYITPITLTVTAESSGVVTAASVTTAGRYTTKPSNPVSQASTTGSGSGATFTITWASALLFTDAAGSNLGTSLGASEYATSTILQVASQTDLQTLAGGQNVATATLTFINKTITDSSNTIGINTLPIITLAKGGSGQATALAARGSSGFNIDQATSTSFNAESTIAAATRVVMSSSTAMTGTHTLTLPAANTINSGQTLYVLDLNGVVGSNTLALLRSGSDTINGSTSVSLTLQYGGYVLVSDGSSKWSAETFGSTVSAGAGISVSSTTVSINTNNALGVGAYAIFNATNVVASGGTLTGSDLSYAFGSASTGGTWESSGTGSGTWRNVSGVTLNGQSGLFIRTA